MSNRCSDPFDLHNAPAGSGTAHRFPWWQSGAFVRSPNIGLGIIAAGDRFRFRAFGPIVPYIEGAAPLFNNPFSWPIYITEIRFLCISIVQPETIYKGDYEDLGRQVGIKISTTNRGDVLKEFVPMAALNTDPYVAQGMETSGAVITLPSDYFIPSDADFGADLGIFTPSTLGASAKLQMGIRGCDPYNHSPVARFSEYQDVSYAATKSGSAFHISGTAGGQSLRNMWMRDLTFAMNDAFNANFSGSFWHQALLRVDPPQGPKWTTDLVTPVSCIADQVSISKSAITGVNAGRRDTIISHKPVQPYLLMPQDRMDIEGTFYSDLQYNDVNTSVVIIATVRGYQEAPNVG